MGPGPKKNPLDDRALAAQPWSMPHRFPCTNGSNVTPQNCGNVALGGESGLTRWGE